MANVEVHAGLDMLRPRPINSGPFPTISYETYFQVGYSVFTGTFRGTGLTYSADTVTGGTLTDLDISLSGRLFVNRDLNIVGMQVDAREAALHIRAGDFPGFLALALTGDDTIKGSVADDVLLGYGGNDVIHGNAGNDTLRGGDGNDLLIDGIGTPQDGVIGHNHLDGGAGFDRAQYAQNIDRFTIKNDGQAVTLTSKDGMLVDTLVDVERVQFADSVLAFDFVGVAGQAYRIYQAAFDRTPDTGGLSYWIKAMDGGMSLLDVSRHFIGSAEFTAAYGTFPANADFVDRLYDNILGRDGEAGGVAFWMEQLSAGMKRELVLLHFSESPENTVGTAPTIHDGIHYYAV